MPLPPWKLEKAPADPGLIFNCLLSFHSDNMECFVEVRGQQQVSKKQH